MGESVKHRNLRLLWSSLPYTLETGRGVLQQRLGQACDQLALENPEARSQVVIEYLLSLSKWFKYLGSISINTTIEPCQLGSPSPDAAAAHSSLCSASCGSLVLVTSNTACRGAEGAGHPRHT